MTYTVQEAFTLLKRYGLAEHIEVVRRWLRQGTLKGTPPVKRREGWRIEEEDLQAFILARAPGLADLNAIENQNTTNVVKQQPLDVAAIQEEARIAYWWELIGRFIFEDFIEVRRSVVKDILEVRPYEEASKASVLADVFRDVPKGKKLRVNYLHGAFPFRGQRVAFNAQSPDREEEIAGRLLDAVWARRRQNR